MHDAYFGTFGAKNGRFFTSKSVFEIPLHINHFYATLLGRAKVNKDRLYGPLLCMMNISHCRKCSYDVILQHFCI